VSIGLYAHTTRATGTVLTAIIYNGDHVNHITNQNPQQTGAYSDTVAQMQSTVTPGGVGTESLASSLSGELERLRFVLKTLHGGAQWYPGQQMVASGTSITPAQLTVNTNDYNPASLTSAGVLRLSSNARINITGLTAPVSDGTTKFIQNVGTFPLVFTFQDALSSAANRFAFAITLGGGQSMTLQYDLTAALWRSVGQPDAPIGSFRDLGGSVVPGGYLGCDGSAVSRTTYASLFNEIGTTWGVGDGATTFNLPPASRVLIGSGTATTVETITAQTAAGNAVPVASNNTKWITGMPVVVSGASGFAGLVNGSFWIIRSASNTVQFATSLANAQNGTAMVVTGTGSATLTTTFTARAVGEMGGEEAHAQNINELLAHTHSTKTLTALTANGPDQFANNAGGLGLTGSTGGNAAMNILQPFAVVTRGIKYA
jgi:microcystin-dependent protein